MSEPKWMADLRAKASAAEVQDGGFMAALEAVEDFRRAASPQTVLWLLDMLALAMEDDQEDPFPQIIERYRAGPVQGDAK